MTAARDAILAHEEKFAQALSRVVLDRPKLSFWMILIPVIFVYYFYQLNKFSDGCRDFRRHFMLSRQRALDEAQRALEEERALDIGRLVREAANVPPPAVAAYTHWITVLARHYHDLLQADAADYGELVRKVYKNRTAFLLFANQLNQAEKAFNAAVAPHTEGAAESVKAVIGVMERFSVETRREEARRIFP